MSKKISECCDMWCDPQTLLVADNMTDTDFEQELNNSHSLEEFECGVKDKIDSCIAKSKSDCCKIQDKAVRQLALAALSTVDIDKLVSVVLGCFVPEVRMFKLESRINRLYTIMVEKRKVKNERSTTPAIDGELAAFDIAVNFKKDDIDVDSEVDGKNKKDAWILRLVYNDGNKENISMVKPDDNKDDYLMKSDKDKLKVKFSDDPEDGTLNVPQSVIDHIAKHIEQAEKNIEANKKKNDSDLAHEIAYDIKKEFPNYDMEVIEGDVGGDKWTIEIVYKDGKKESFVIKRIGDTYFMKSDKWFLAKFTLDELKNFPKKLAEHIKKNADKAEKK